MINAMLKAFNVAPLPPIGSFDLTANTGDGIRAVSVAPEKIVLEATLPSVPFFYDAGSAATVSGCGLAELVDQKITLRGLKEPAYDLTIDAQHIGKVTAEALAAGYVLPGNASARGRMLRDLIQRKENNYYSAWRDVRLPLAALPASADLVDAMMNVDTKYTSIINDMAAQKDKITLTLIPRPATANLAADCHYACSDPNGYNWGIGGLTDGSWDADGTHCFATGDADAFPKTATIDLEKAAQLATVIVGVPQFGATKTITVSVSADGKTFTEVGTHVFDQQKADRFSYKFEPVTARYVRLTYPDHYTEGAGYPNTFVFTTEAEAYPPTAAK